MTNQPTLNTTSTVRRAAPPPHLRDLVEGLSVHLVTPDESEKLKRLAEESGAIDSDSATLGL